MGARSPDLSPKLRAELYQTKDMPPGKFFTYLFNETNKPILVGYIQDDYNIPITEPFAITPPKMIGPYKFNHYRDSGTEDKIIFDITYNNGSDEYPIIAKIRVERPLAGRLIIDDTLLLNIEMAKEPFDHGNIWYKRDKGEWVKLISEDPLSGAVVPLTAIATATATATAKRGGGGGRRTKRKQKRNRTRKTRSKSKSYSKSQ